MSLRRLVYEAGFRPKSNSVLFSPTLDLEYAWRDAYKDGLPWSEVRPILSTPDIDKEEEFEDFAYKKIAELRTRTFREVLNDYSPLYDDAQPGEDRFYKYILNMNETLNKENQRLTEQIAMMGAYIEEREKGVCLTCNALIWNGTKWIRARTTERMVCTACGTSYER